MRKIIFTICFCLITSLAFSAELLVTMRTDSNYGDIIVVKPDGWKWGKSEQPPQYVVFKLPGISEKDAKKYEESLVDENGEMVKSRKYSIDTLEVDYAKIKVKGVKEIHLDKIVEFKEKKIKDKTK